MTYGVEARAPFLDHELVELIARIPPGLNARGPVEKSILREALRGVLPEEIRRRKLGAVLMAVLGVQFWDETFLRGNAAIARS